MTSAILEFRDSLVDLLDGDVDLDEIVVVESAGRPRTLFKTTPPPGLAPGTVVWIARLTRRPDPASLRGDAGPGWDEQLEVELHVDVELAGDDPEAAQTACVELTDRIVRTLRDAIRDRRRWTSMTARSTKVTQVDVAPPVLFQGGGAGCRSEITIEHNARST